MEIINALEKINQEEQHWLFELYSSVRLGLPEEFDLICMFL